MLVAKKNDSRSEGPCFQEFQVRFGPFCKETLSAPQNNRIDQEPILID